MTGDSTSAVLCKHQVLVRVKLPTAPNSAQVHLRWERLPDARTGAQVRRFFCKKQQLVTKQDSLKQETQHTEFKDPKIIGLKLLYKNGCGTVFLLSFVNIRS